ncbi:MAG: hypothetical protein R3D00_01310 [Bacteroidia bacterium]
MKVLSCLLFFSVFVSIPRFFAQPDAGNGKSFAVTDVEDSPGDFLTAELDEMVLWRLLEINRPDLRRTKDDILLENQSLTTLREETLASLSQYQHLAAKLDSSNAALEEDNDHLREIRAEMVFRLVDLTNEKDLLFTGDADEDYDLEMEESDAIREEIVLLDMQLDAYDRKMEQNAMAIYIQEQMISEAEDVLFEAEETAEICLWLTEININLLRQ